MRKTRVSNALVGVVASISLLMLAGCAGTSPSMGPQGSGSTYEFYLSVPELQTADTRPATLSVDGSTVTVDTQSQTGDAIALKGELNGSVIRFAASDDMHGHRQRVAFQGKMMNDGKAEGVMDFYLDDQLKFQGEWRLTALR